MAVVRWNPTMPWRPFQQSWTPAGDPWTTLLWCNGRVALPDHARLSDWLWHPAPLSAWDGTRRRERCKAGRERLTTCDAQA